MIRNHQAFQGEHYYHYLGAPTDLRKQWVDEPWYDLAVKLVDEWDAPAFDPNFEVDPIESFEPLMRKVFHDKPGCGRLTAAVVQALEIERPT